MTSSSDNGGTWTKNLRVTDQSVNRRIGPWLGNADIRQPLGLVSRNGLSIVTLGLALAAPAARRRGVQTDRAGSA